jgi:hypothetical protein
MGPTATVTVDARTRARVPLLTPFYVLALARAWRQEVRPTT